jgi:hypothetical protein
MCDIKTKNRKNKEAAEKRKKTNHNKQHKKRVRGRSTERSKESKFNRRGGRILIPTAKISVLRWSSSYN